MVSMFGTTCALPVSTQTSPMQRSAKSPTRLTCRAYSSSSSGFNIEDSWAGKRLKHKDHKGTKTRSLERTKGRTAKRFFSIFYTSRLRVLVPFQVPDSILRTLGPGRDLNTKITKALR